MMRLRVARLQLTAGFGRERGSECDAHSWWQLSASDSAFIDALEREFGGRCYVNGSVAHGDALTPLTDIDLGVIVPNEDGIYGPGRRGPAELQERAAAAIRRELEDDFPNLRISWVGRRRAVFVQFGDPVTPGQKDFTADVITATTRPCSASSRRQQSRMPTMRRRKRLAAKRERQ